MSNVNKILVVNSGSSSLKYMLFDMKDESMLCKGLVERIGTASANLVYQRAGGKKREEAVKALTHGEAFEHVCKAITNKEDGAIAALSEIDAVGHRVLHGGMEFTAPALVNATVKKAIRKCFDLGPLHNPPNLTGIEACEKKMKGVPNVAVFDTGFHMTMPAESYMYAIPRDLAKKYSLRKYGFHGTSHKYVTETAAKVFKKPLSRLNIVTCHLGNGSSLAAIKGGKVFDTTMGLTPLQGLVMGTRSGDIDPAVCFFLAKKEGMDAEALDTLLNKKSGLLAISGTGSGDMRDLCAAVQAGKKEAKEAFDLFVHRIILYIGGYMALLGKVDGIVFAGGIGENSDFARKAICERLAPLGLKLDAKANKATHGTLARISAADSKLPAWVIPTNEELMIDRETYRIVAAR
ncbi:MAG: acetate kinase [Kiritimatiellae bacterium]|nr:acetate kinase [Kiritimatiellia bacterium]